MNLQPIQSKDLGRRVALEIGSPGLLGIIERPDSRAAEQIAARLGRNAGRIEAPGDVRALLTRLMGSTEDPLIVSHLEDLPDEAWRRLDRQRDRLLRAGLTLFVLSTESAERLDRNAPNLVSLFSGFYRWEEEATEPATTAGDEAAAQEEFDRFAAQWIAETTVASSLKRKVRHPAYQRIIAMGERAIRPILRALEKEPQIWGPALHAITGALPVPPEDAGRVSRVAQAWLSWARENGYVW